MRTHAYCPSYTSELWHPITFAEVCAWVIEKAREADVEALAASGHSGLPVAAVAAHALGINLIAVRQPKCDTNDYVHEVNGILALDRPVRYGIVDDFIESGNTIERIITQITREWPKSALTHVFCWWQGHSSNAIPPRLVSIAEDVTVVTRDRSLPF